jgi:hypothetical protein
MFENRGAIEKVFCGLFIIHDLN